jgi:LAO/AO transport system kinase
MSSSPVSEENFIETLLKETLKNGIITCADIRKIAEKAEVSYRKAGETADMLRIKVRDCEPGCF